MNQKNVFWEALLLAIFIFASGLFLGYLLESSRTSKIISVYQQLEFNLLDIQVQSNLISLQDINCNTSIESIISLADRAYNESKILDRYEGSADLSESIQIQHKKYDLLRAVLWSNSLKIKEKCDNKFHRVVYFYEYNPTEIETQSKQNVFSKYLGELKEREGDNIILIPISGNLEISSIDSLRSMYNIDSLPMILVDESFKVDNFEDLKKIDSYLN